MKRTYFLLLILLPLFAQAQTSWDKAGIQQMLDEYANIMETMDIAKTLEYIHPKIFDMVSREMMEEQLSKTLEDTSTVKISMHDYEIDKIGKTIKKEGVHFARVDYHFRMDMKFAKGIESDSMDKNAFMKTMLETKYGKNNVKLNEKTGAFEINVVTSLFAIGDPAIGSWKMIENKPSAADFIQTIMPKKVYKKLR